MPDTETLEQVTKAGRQRLYPSITDPNWLILRKRRQLFQQWLSKVPPGNLCVLDVGGRIQPYRSMLDTGVHYVALDHRRSPLVDVVAQAEQIPLAGERFDVVICTQMLEYASEPALVIAEIRRVLKRGGVLLLSVPAVFPRDSERDCWRFLPGGLRHLLGGFAAIDLKPEGGSLTGFIRTVNVCLLTFAKPAALNKILQFSVVPALNLAGATLDYLAAGTDDRFSANFSVMAQK